ncbi:hypothetical protein J41TS12_31230 [Paenibacillus antibioticophila]|uniref:Uncharacterized protein n=1 Tax=Paenibacillus antibioticophila TaxID=1274374 RepID=A0A920CIX1_9BACL|nr:DUF5685 family protein [Paenibacillus antibioticophila]GIO38262.1 hypothetical protein J41TS12_31230 [Paenibacillus antibioticophila]
MFGYIMINPKQLSESDKERYQAMYCGLCRVLDERHGKWGRTTLTYDLTFVSMLLSSLYVPQEEQAMQRCLIHPVRQLPYITTEITEYAADMNLVLAYYKALDDWNDDHSLTAKNLLKLLEPGMKKVEARWPGQCTTIRDSLALLTQMEQANELNPDLPANVFGEVMGKLLVIKEDEWSAQLYRLGAALGRFIYIMDASMDLASDLKHGRYNPLTAQSNIDHSLLLTMLISECTQEFEALPLQRDQDILRNILYSGVWMKFKPRKEEVSKHHERSL